MITKSKLKPNILYVDDNETNLVLFEATFQNNYNVFTTDSGEKALEILEKNKFAVIISDQRMPGMTGNELLEQVEEKFPDVMRFILTAYTDNNTVIESINKGKIYGFFTKPFDAATVKTAINKAIEVYHLREENKEMLIDLAKSNRELQEIDISKTRFLSEISNEIRTPINKIMSTIHVLKDKLETNELNELISFLDTSVSRLENFSNAAIQLARLNDRNHRIHPVNISVKELVELCIIEKKNDIDEAGIIIEVNNPGQNVSINGEYELLVNCLSILLVNSMNHSKTNAIIQINIGEDKESIYLEVIDDGNNFSRNHNENLSNFFSEKDRSFDYSIGIEMVLVKHIMISHGGWIAVKQNENNRISTKMVFPYQII